jgi:hypothetical protein
MKQKIKKLTWPLHFNMRNVKLQLQAEDFSNPVCHIFQTQDRQRE